MTFGCVVSCPHLCGPAGVAQHEVSGVYVAVVVTRYGQAPAVLRLEEFERSLRQYKERVGVLPPQVWRRQVDERIVERRYLRPQHVAIGALGVVPVPDHDAVAVLDGVLLNVPDQGL